MLRNNFKISRRNPKHNKAYNLINVLGLSLGIACTIFILFSLGSPSRSRGWLSFDTFHSKNDRIILARKEADGRQDLVVRNGVGMQLMVAEENTQPTLRIVLPGHPTSDRSIEVIFPEHVTVRKRGSHRRKSALPLATGAIRRATAVATVRAIPGVREKPFRRRSHAGASNARRGWRSLSLQAPEPVRHDLRSDLCSDRSTAHLGVPRRSIGADVRPSCRWFRSARFGNAEPFDDAARSMVARPVPRLVHLADTVAARRTS